MDLDETAIAFEADLLASSELCHTPCGDGSMVWHIWGAGPPLVMLHGGSGSWRHWALNIRELSRHYRLYVADLPGLGDSDMPPKLFDINDFPGSVDHLAEITCTGIEELLPSGTPFKILGFSFGSITAGYVAARMQDRVEHLALVGPASFGLPWGGIQGHRKSPKYATNDAEIKEFHRHNLHLVMFGDAANIDDLALHLQIECVTRARLRSHRISGTDTLLRALKRLHVPFSALWGKGDVYSLPNLESRPALLRTLQPEADCRVIDGAGHWVMYEAADAFNAAILEQLGATALRKVG
jgi:pimeloyl-ACP methyl ester carboxylesterase